MVRAQADSRPTAVGSTLYFVAGDNNFGKELWKSDGNTATRVTDINATGNNPTGNSDPQYLTKVGSTLFFSADNGTNGRELWKADANGASLVSDLQTGPSSGTPTFFANVNGRVVFQALVSGTNTLWQSQGQAADTFLVRDNLGATLLLKVLDAEGDGSVTTADGTSAASTTITVPINYSERTKSSGLMTADLTSVIRSFLDAGKTRLTARLEFAHDNLSLNIQNSLAQGANSLGVPVFGPGATELIVTPPTDGVLLDLFDAQGTSLVVNQAAVDLRNFDAGTYFVKVHRPLGASTTAAIPFTLDFTVPFAGQTRPVYENPDRDVIHGGDGDDDLIGSDDIDHLFGDDGEDVFVADALEVRPDRFGITEITTIPVTGDTIANVITNRLDPEINIPDTAVRAAVAFALGIPVTTRFDGTARLSRGIRASELASLVRLDLSGRGVTSLEGLQYATNLRG